MNTLLKVLALVLTAALPVTVTADVLGAAIPAVIDTTSLFCTFIVVLMLLTITTDYRSIEASGSAAAPAGCKQERASLRLAA